MPDAEKNAVMTRLEVLAPLLTLAEEIKTGPYTCSGKFVRLHRALIQAAQEEDPEPGPASS